MTLRFVIPPLREGFWSYPAKIPPVLQWVGKGEREDLRQDEKCTYWKNTPATVLLLTYVICVQRDEYLTTHIEEKKMVDFAIFFRHVSIFVAANTVLKLEHCLHRDIKTASCL